MSSQTSTIFLCTWWTSDEERQYVQMYWGPTLLDYSAALTIKMSICKFSVVLSRRFTREKIVPYQRENEHYLYCEVGTFISR